MKIYTKTGDEGTSSLFDGKRVKKSHPRLMAYGELDLLNVIISECIFECNDDHLQLQLEIIQQKIFKLSSVLATEKLKFLGETSEFVSLGDIEVLENWIDVMTSKLPELKTFIVPGGTRLAINIHKARVITRAAERYIVDADLEGEVNTLVLQYINRLSDYFFTAARYANWLENVEDVNVKIA
jgi:cob(I)alamin adenosyltransferase